MRDLKLSYTDKVGFDIDIIEGYPTYVDYENQTQDQRAAVGAIITKGTIPGQLQLGVDWSALYDKSSSMVDIDNDVKQMVQLVAGGNGEVNNQYIPVYMPQDDGSVGVVVMRGE